MHPLFCQPTKGGYGNEHGHAGCSTISFLSHGKYDVSNHLHLLCCTVHKIEMCEQMFKMIGKCAKLELWARFEGTCQDGSPMNTSEVYEHSISSS